MNPNEADDPRTSESADVVEAQPVDGKSVEDVPLGDGEQPVPTAARGLRSRLRFSLATVMMLVLTAAAASALFAKVQHYSETPERPTWKFDSPILVTMAIGFTAVALGAMKDHTLNQMMLQATLAFLGYLSLIWLGESGQVRILVYWFEVAFALTVALPLLARKYVKAELPRGHRRTWWKKTFEAIVFSFLCMLLASIGVALQFYIAMISEQVLKK